eukprot:4118582-Pleurochrysis_carterae.AAC.1
MAAFGTEATTKTRAHTRRRIIVYSTRSCRVESAVRGTASATVSTLRPRSLVIRRGAAPTPVWISHLVPNFVWPHHICKRQNHLHRNQRLLTAPAEAIATRSADARARASRASAWRRGRARHHTPLIRPDGAWRLASEATSAARQRGRSAARGCLIGTQTNNLEQTLY